MKRPGWLMHAFMLALMLLPVAVPHARENTSVVRAGTIEIRRTTDDIPHIRAANWRDLGFGYGYAQVQDALCTLADAFVTYEGRRSLFTSAGRPAPRAESRTLWRRQFGPVVNLERYAPALGWSTQTALTIRDISTANTHALRNWQHERALNSPRRNTALLRYAEQLWLRFPFDEREIERDVNLRRIVLNR